MKNVGCFNIKISYVKNYGKEMTTHNFSVFKGDGGYLNKEDHIKKEQYSLTHHKEAKFLSKYILKKVTGKEKVLVVDATTSIGGNFLSFIDHFDYIIGTEVNSIRFQKLIENIEKKKKIRFTQKGDIRYVYDKRIILINDSFITHLNYIIAKSQKFNKSVIFIDPPWGGKQYKNFDYILLGLHGIPINVIINKILLLKKDIIVIAKLPKNYLFGLFENAYRKIDMGNFYYVDFSTQASPKKSLILKN